MSKDNAVLIVGLLFEEIGLPHSAFDFYYYMNFYEQILIVGLLFEEIGLPHSAFDF